MLSWLVLYAYAAAPEHQSADQVCCVPARVACNPQQFNMAAGADVLAVLCVIGPHAELTSLSIDRQPARTASRLAAAAMVGVLSSTCSAELLK